MGDLPESQVICNVKTREWGGAEPIGRKYQCRLSQDEDEGPHGGLSHGMQELHGWQDDRPRLWLREEVCGIQPYPQDVSNGCVEDACQVSTSDEVEPDGADTID